MVTFSPQTHQACGPGACAPEGRELHSTIAQQAYFARALADLGPAEDILAPLTGWRARGETELLVVQVSGQHS
jgi:hypothetical protein